MICSEKGGLALKDLRRNFEQFCLKHRDLGIPNLMLWIAIGTVAVYVLQLIDPSGAVFRALYFSPQAILKGQIWRLVSYIFLPNESFVLFFIIMLVFYVQIGRVMEGYWGRFKFNLFYFLGILLMDIGGLILKTSVSVGYLNILLLLSYATLAPEAQVLIFGIIPFKMKWLAWVYLAMLLLSVLRTPWPALLMPFFPLLDYVLFFGKDVLNVLPRFGKLQVRKKAEPKPNPNWADRYRKQPSQQQKPYHHKCTVCGRTDTDYPGLEFRYCSRCNGYYCYCMEHINNPEHIL